MGRLGVGWSGKLSGWVGLHAEPGLAFMQRPEEGKKRTREHIKETHVQGHPEGDMGLKSLRNPKEAHTASIVFETERGGW